MGIAASVAGRCNLRL